MGTLESSGMLLQSRFTESQRQAARRGFEAAIPSFRMYFAAYLTRALDDPCATISFVTILLATQIIALSTVRLYS